MEARQRFPTPLTIASHFGTRLLPISLFAGLSAGVVARGWMRLISTDPEFSWQGTLGIIAAFIFFATLQGLPALASTRGWRPWPTRVMRGLGVVGLLPLFGAAGALMAPFVVAAALAVWRPAWPRMVRAALGLLAMADLFGVAYTIFSDHGISLKSLLGVVGLVVIYAWVVWAAAATFSAGRSAPAPEAHALSAL